MRIAGKRQQPRVFDWAADCEVIQALELAPLETQHAVKRVIEITANPGASNAGGLGFQIQRMAQQSGFPEQSSIPPAAHRSNTVFKFRQHAEAECAGARDLLMATHHLRLLPTIAIDKSEQPQL